MKNQPFLFQIAASHTTELDLLLLAILIRGEGGYDIKHKIIDRTLRQNKVHGLKSVLLQLVVDLLGAAGMKAYQQKGL